MGHIEQGELQAYLDNALPPQEHRAIDAHLTDCTDCRERLEAQRASAAHISGMLDALSPGPLDAPDQRHALAAIQGKQQRRSTPMFDKLFSDKRWRRAGAAIAALVVLVGLFALQPVRALASDFLGLFRVERFVVVDIDPDRINQIAEAVDEDMYFGEQEMIEEMGAPREAASLEEAAGQVDFSPRAPQGYGEPAMITVSDGGQMRYTPDVETLRTVFEALGLDPDMLPENIDGQPFDITVPVSVEMMYDDGDPDTSAGDFVVLQVPSPTVDVPEGVDMQALGEAMLQVLGMSPREARRLSASIDWTTTLVVPIPANVASVQEVEINGTTGLMFDVGAYDDVDGGGGALLWQENGIVTMIAGTNSSVNLLAIADSLE